MNQYKFIIPEEHQGKRLDAFLSECEELDMTRSAVQKLILSGNVLVNSKERHKNYALSTGDEVIISVPEPVALDVQPQDIPVEIVYEDGDLLVVNKPKGMVVHPAPGNYDGTLVNALLFHCSGKLSGINGVIRPGIVHRIDKETSGLLIVAKTDKAHLGLAEQIKDHSFTREYEAVVTGRFKDFEGTVNAPIGRHPVDRKKMCVTEKNSKNAVTHYKVLDEWGGAFSHLHLSLETGRTHQIRVHMAYLGHPVLGDTVYGKSYPGLTGQCLHAKKIGFIHPVSGSYLEFDSQLPEYFQNIISKLNRQYH